MSEDARQAGEGGRALGATSDRFALRPREILAILLFWAFLAALSISGRLLDPRIPNLPANVTEAVVRLSLIEYALWALLTVPIFWLSSRFSVEGGRRLGRVLLMVAIGVVVAIAMDRLLAAFRAELLPFRGGRRGPPRGPGPLEFLDDLMVYFAVLAAGVARDYFLRYQARLEETVRLQQEAAHLEAQLADARLAVLRTQLNPHFLFNTLNAVSALVERDPRGVRRMIARLSELLRFTLEGSTEQEIPLERELDVLRRYVEIMEIRFQGRLTFSAEVDDEARRALVPTLVLQPLVENAMKHGVGRLEGAGTISLRARRVGDELVLSVRDNGPGPDGDGAAPVAAGGEGGVGLENTRQRLEQLYGARQRLTLRAAPEGGAIAEIALPWHTRAEPRALNIAAR